MRANRKPTGYEQRSRATWFDLPLVHVAVGRDPFTGKRRMACGIVAIGQLAVGVVAICQFGAGLIALSQFGVGVLFGMGQSIAAPAAVAQFAAAVLAAVGQFAVGWLAVGQMAAGFGGLVVGQSALNLGAMPGAALLAWTPAVLAWAVAAAALRGMGKSQPRSRTARELPRLAPCSVGDLRPGQQLLRATVAPEQGAIVYCGRGMQRTRPGFH